MKKSLVLVLALMLVMSVSGFVAQGGPPPFSADITLTDADDNPGPFAVELGQDLDLKAVFQVNHKVNNEAWSVDGVVKQSSDDIEDDLVPVHEDPNDDTSEVLHYLGDSEFTFTTAGMDDNDIGTYEVTFKIWRQTGPPASPTMDREAEESEEVEVVEASIEILVLPMAAPNVAELILAYPKNDVPARYGTRNSGGNFVQDVAHQMGLNEDNNTDFMGEAKEDQCDAGVYYSRREYRQAVLDWLNDHDHVPKELVMPCDTWFATLGEECCQDDNGNGGLPATSNWTMTITSHWGYWEPQVVSLTLWAAGDTVTGEFLLFDTNHNISGTLTGQEFVGVAFTQGGYWTGAFEMTFNEVFDRFDGQMWYLNTGNDPYDTYLGATSGTLTP